MRKALILSSLLMALILLQIPLSLGQSSRESIERAIESPLKSVSSAPDYGSSSDISQGGYGFVNGILYVDKSGFTFGPIPDLEMNIYASLILSEALQASSFMTLDERDVSRARERLTSINTWILDNAKAGGLWGSDVSGRLVDVYFSSLAIRSVAGALSSGGLPKEKLSDLARAVSQLIKYQDKGGGWGRIPEADVFQLKEPSPDITAQVLKSILAARETGIKASGLDESIRKAVSYLEGTARRNKNFVYWQEKKSSSAQITGDVADALAEAMFQGFDVDSNNIIQGIINYLENYVKESYSSGAYDIFTGLALNALAKFSSLGFLETDKFVSSWEPLIEDLAHTIKSDGLFTSLPFIWLRYSFTYTYVSIFAYWLRVSSVSSQAYFVGGYGSFNPPVVVEGTDITLKIKVENKIGKTLALLMSLNVESPAIVKTSLPSRLALSGGKYKEFSIKIAAPDKISSPKNVSVKLYIKDSSGKPLFTKALSFRILRNPRLSLESKVVHPTAVQIRKPVNVTLTMSNIGDLPISDISIIEKLGAGFELVTNFPGNGTALVTSTNSLGSYVIPTPLNPGSKMTLIYQVMPTDVAPGPQTVSTTLIAYTDARGETHNISKEVKVTVLRPYVILSSNATSLKMEWDEERSLVIAVSNTGNEDATDVELKVATGEGANLNLSMVPKNVLMRPNPDGSMLLRVDKLKSGDTLSIPLRLKATNFYPATELGSFLSIGYDYKDSIGRSMPYYSGSTIVKVDITVSKNFIYLVSAIILAIAALLAIRIYNRSRRARRERTSPLIKLQKKRKGRSPFGS